MENKLFGLNRGIWCGKVVSSPEFDHSVVDKESGETIKEYYTVEVEVEFENAAKTIKDVSVLPFLISKDNLDSLEKTIEVGDLLFAKGEYRAFDRFNEELGKRQTITRVAAKKVQIVTGYTRTRNKIEFHGVLKSKLYKAQFTEDGKMKKDDKNRPLPVLDENGEKIPWVRRNTESLTVNDFILEISKTVVDSEGNEKRVYCDYTPMISYGAVAWQIAKEIKEDTKVMARGYVRRRPKNGCEGEYVYEPVITRITPVKDSEEELNESTND